MSQIQVVAQRRDWPLLEPRFADLKRSIIKPERKQKVIDFYKQLLIALQKEAALIASVGPAMVPEVDFELVRENGGNLPSPLVDIIKERGCVILRNVVSEEQATRWEAELKKYTQAHSGVGGFPSDNPQIWSLWWTRPQVEIRSHERVLEATNAVSKLWHTSDPSAPIDLTTQVAYADRFRIRYPCKVREYPFGAHLDNGSIERWEDPTYRECYRSIFDGDWPDYDAWSADGRSNAQTDLYHRGGNCSCWRSMQGWLALSHTSTGEGTLRLRPSLKASTAYLMLRPFFPDGPDSFDDSQPTFPGAHPGETQLLPTAGLHPHLEMDKTVVGIPPVKPGDYVFWHCDVLHEVDKTHPGTRDSSVVYNACTPLVPYNINSLSDTREAFLAARPPRDFAGLVIGEAEHLHDDNGAKKEHILSEEGRRAMGFAKFDVDEAGISEGQRKVRRTANECLHDDEYIAAT